MALSGIGLVLAVPCRHHYAGIELKPAQVAVQEAGEFSGSGTPHRISTSSFELSFLEIRAELARHGIHLLDWDELTEPQRQVCIVYFRRNVFPVLTPLAVDPGYPFPFISNFSTSLAMFLTSSDSEGRSFARSRCPKSYRVG